MGLQYDFRLNDQFFPTTATPDIVLLEQKLHLYSTFFSGSHEQLVN